MDLHYQITKKHQLIKNKSQAYNNKFMKFKKRIITLFLLVVNTYLGMCQQDPLFTQYSYNTMTANPAYTGSRGHLNAIALYRNQWSNIEGAPKTISFGIDSPVGIVDGIGLSIIQDELGPSSETFIDFNYSHHLILNRNGDRLALGLKGGARFFSLDWSKGRHRDPEAVFNENVNSKLLPTAGAGVFFYTDRAFIGVSTPNIFLGKHYDAIEEEEATEKMHLFLLTGYVFDLNPFLKFKPTLYAKYVSGAPISVDGSVNFLLNEVLTLGVNYRWDESVSALIGFQFSPKVSMGYAYDYSINELNSYNSGTHEIFIRFQAISKLTKLKSPRFF